MKIDSKQNPKIKFDTINEGLEYSFFSLQLQYSFKFAIIISTTLMATHFKDKKTNPSAVEDPG